MFHKKHTALIWRLLYIYIYRFLRYGEVAPPARLAAELQAATTEREDMQMQVKNY